MLQVARLSPKVLGESTPLVVDFLRGQLHAEGGFCDRDGKSDLYYTTFGLAGLMALQAPLPVAQVTAYLETFGDGRQLQLIELSCLARCWTAFSGQNPVPGFADQVLARTERFRTPDGGFHVAEGEPRGSVYGCFLALGIAQDVGLSLPDARQMLSCIADLRASDGGFANSHDIPFGLVPPTAAAVALHRHLGAPPPDGAKQWLLAQLHRDGGFRAGPGAVLPDLLSTATALHALDSLHADLQPLREPCLDFIDTLWTARGGFHGTWEDPILDCEYTYYGLLSLGHLGL
jgi:prenyltransferase beta subunit